MSELIAAGLDLVIYGMGTVFVFLTVLVLVTMAMSALVQLSIRLGTNGDEMDGDVSSDTVLMAAVTAAVKSFRKGHH